MIKLIATDVDGTLVKDGTMQIDPEYMTVIKQLVQKGIIFAVCSGRQFISERKLFAPIKDQLLYITDGGTVVRSRYSDSYGNYVMINHDGNMQTLYAHMSGTAVSEGQTVNKGDVIGYLGETGWATGVHCHFEVYVGGSTVDPEGYFPGLPHWNC